MPRRRRGLDDQLKLRAIGDLKLTVSHGKVDVEHSHELGMGLDDFPDTLSSESLLPESSLDLVQDLLVTGLGLVEDYYQRQLAEMRGEYPPFLRAK